MNKISFFSLLISFSFIVPVFAQQACTSFCDQINPPFQGAALGGSWSMGGCRDKEAMNHELYATYDAGECVYKDGTKISAKSDELVRDENGKPTGDTKTRVAAREAEARMTRAVPEFFTSEGFTANSLKTTPEGISNALKTLKCQKELLSNNLSPRTKLASDEVKTLQTFLRQRSGKQILITGNYRAQTSKSVREIQKSFIKGNAYTRGVVDTQTRALINKLECEALFGEYLNKSN